jgi:hypothetical protein
MPSAIKRVPKRRPSRRKNNMANRPQPTSPIQIVSATKALTVLTITFNQPVALSGVPQYEVVGVVGATPVSAAMTSATVLTVTYSVSIATATAVNIPYEEKAIRNASGGFVATSTFALT